MVLQHMIVNRWGLYGSLGPVAAMGTYVLGRARLVTLEGDVVGASFRVLRVPHITSLPEVGSAVMLLSVRQDAREEVTMMISCAIVRSCKVSEQPPR